MIFGLVGCSDANDKENYEKAKECIEKGFTHDFEEAISCLEKVSPGYEDAEDLLIECKFAYAISTLGYADQFRNPDMKNRTYFELADIFDANFYEYQLYDTNEEREIKIAHCKEALEILTELKSQGYGYNIDEYIDVAGYMIQCLS